ncbi:hypothetical protein B4135_0732 [Caldibacillus debilis]|jgi:hypothetical protein|uniref:Uncharacterized protein n=1 Tax=Caldibacillus debilis TaxID=301148 RepID=A0A150M5N5_9BACI|nr:hypothetical protein B4135_0732 [Caldibacillus debilis]
MLIRKMMISSHQIPGSKEESANVDPEDRSGKGIKESPMVRGESF